MERFSDGTTGRDGRGPAFPKETGGIPHGAKHLPYNKIRENGTRSGHVIRPVFRRIAASGRAKEAARADAPPKARDESTKIRPLICRK
jgi:hypothetical protein